MKRIIFGILACLLLTMGTPAMTSASSASTLIGIANGYIGSPYSYGGTTSSGFDCSGFTQRVFSDAGSSLPRSTSGQFAVGASVAKENLQAGDLVFFNTSGKGVSHVGLYIGSNNFIHASSSRGVMISSIYDPHYWGSRYIGARRPNVQPTEKPKTEEVAEEKVEKKEEKPKAKKEVKKTSKPVTTQKVAEKPQAKPVTQTKAVSTPPVQEANPEEIPDEEVEVESELEIAALLNFEHLHPTSIYEFQAHLAQDVDYYLTVKKIVS